MRILSFKKFIFLIAVFVSFFTTNTYAASDNDQAKVNAIVDNIIQPLMQKYNIPGLAVAVTIDGRNYFYNYGIAAKNTNKPITNQTIFEIGSVTKTFTATLAIFAEENNKLSLTDISSHYLPQLRGSNFDKINLLNLGTQTAGLPLQVPSNIKTTNDLIDYLRKWNPAYPIGSHRVYSNLGIGLLGVITANSLQGSYDNLLQSVILNPLKMEHTFEIVPTAELPNYAQGYTDHDMPTRLHEGKLWREAYGIKSCTADLINYVQANMQEIAIPKKLQTALLNTHIAYFKSNYLTQDLIWEQYPLSLQQLLTGNGDSYLEATPITKISPPLALQSNVLINKTGSTDGFSAYIAFIPGKKMGVVLLANKVYPTEEKVKAGYAILSRL